MCGGDSYDPIDERGVSGRRAQWTSGVEYFETEIKIKDLVLERRRFFLCFYIPVRKNHCLGVETRSCTKRRDRRKCQVKESLGRGNDRAFTSFKKTK